MLLLLLGSLASAAPGIVQISAGLGHTCLLQDDGAVACWGGLDGAALKAGGAPSTLVPTPIRGLDAVTSISAGGDNLTCAVRGRGEVWCWKVDQAPTRIDGLQATQVSVGNGHACALDPKGKVWCWGYNARGQIGDGTTEDRPNPVQIDGLEGIRQVEAGFYHTCALHHGGGVSCWGYNLRGQVGNGETGQSVPSPAKVRFLQDATRIAAGSFHSCAVRQNGQVACWGSNGSGQLGDDSRDHSPSVLAVKRLVDAADIDIGMDHGCVVRRSGGLACWGNNEDGQLGTGDLRTRLAPSPTPGLADVQLVATGHQHTCAASRSGTVSCWGSNWTGQLGDGTRQRRLEPARVRLD